MSISSVSNASSLPPVASNVGTYKVIDLETTLTADDKQIVKAATGSEIGQTKAVPHLADAIAISRSLGTLQGPVTASFLQKYASDAEIGATAINKALAFLSNNIPRQQSTNNSGLSIKV